MNNTREERELLEYRADALREQLLDTVSAFDRKRHEVMSWRRRIHRQRLVLAAVGGTLVGGIAAAIVVTKKMREANLPEQRRRAMARVWEHPERVAQKEHQPIWMELGRRLALALLSAVIVTPITSYVKELVKTRHKEGELEAPARLR